jgi:hypothetical protein
MTIELAKNGGHLRQNVAAHSKGVVYATPSNSPTPSQSFLQFFLPSQHASSLSFPYNFLSYKFLFSGISYLSIYLSIFFSFPMQNTRSSRQPPMRDVNTTPNNASTTASSTGLRKRPSSSTLAGKKKRQARGNGKQTTPGNVNSAPHEPIARGTPIPGKNTTDA